MQFFLRGNRGGIQGSVVNIEVTGNLSGIGAVLCDGFGKVVIDRIKMKPLIGTPGNRTFQFFPGSAGPENQFIPLRVPFDQA